MSAKLARARIAEDIAGCGQSLAPLVRVRDGVAALERELEADRDIPA